MILSLTPHGTSRQGSLSWVYGSSLPAAMPDLCRLSSAVGQRAVKPLMRRFESGRRLQSRARLRESLSGRTHAMGQEYAHAIKPGGRIFLYHTGCNAGIFIYRFSSAGRAPVSKTGSAGSSPASGANLPGRPEKLAYMIFSSRSVLCRVGIFMSFFREALLYAKSLPILWADPRQAVRLWQAPNLWTISATGRLPQHAGVAAQARMDSRTRYAPVSLVFDLRQTQLYKSISTPH